MKSIKIDFADGTSRVFEHQGRAGGSYTISLKLENGFAVVIDEYDRRTIFPQETIKEIKTEEFRSW